MHIKKRFKHIIAANPKAGDSNIYRKRRYLRKLSYLLHNAPVLGLNTKSQEEFRDCITDASRNCDYLISCGGDGTLFDVFNTKKVDKKTCIVPFAMGSGNAHSWALKIPRNIYGLCKILKEGRIIEPDLLIYHGEKPYRCMFSSVGLDGYVLKEREKTNLKGFLSYAVGAVKGLALRRYKRTSLEVTVDNQTKFVKSNMITTLNKHPYYGYGLNVNPYAKLCDSNIHINVIDCHLTEFLYGACRIGLGFTYINGGYNLGKKVKITCEDEQVLQCDGEAVTSAKEFCFTIYPKAIKMISI